MSITIMGKTIGKTDAEKDEAFARKMVAEKRKQDRRIIREQMKEASVATKKQWQEQKEQRRLAKEQQKAAMEQTRLEREQKRLDALRRIEQEKAGIQGAKARQAIYTKQRRASSGLGSIAKGTRSAIVGVNKGLVALAGGSRKSTGVSKPRSRAVYVSTSHGLKRVDGGAYGASALPTGKAPPRIKSDDDWGQAGAFADF